MLTKKIVFGLAVAIASCIGTATLQRNFPEEDAEIRHWTKPGARFRARRITVQPSQVTVAGSHTTSLTSTYFIQTIPPQRNVKRAFLNQWSYSGCSNGQGLPPVVSPFPYQLEAGEVSGASCQAFCDQRGDTLAATENGNLCWCGKKGADLVYVDNTHCNTPCAAAPAESCGGDTQLSIYTKAG